MSKDVLLKENIKLKTAIRYLIDQFDLGVLRDSYDGSYIIETTSNYRYISEETYYLFREVISYAKKTWD